MTPARVRNHIAELQLGGFALAVPTPQEVPNAVRSTAAHTAFNNTFQQVNPPKTVTITLPQTAEQITDPGVCGHLTVDDRRREIYAIPFGAHTSLANIPTVTLDDVCALSETDAILALEVYMATSPSWGENLIGRLMQTVNDVVPADPAVRAALARMVDAQADATSLEELAHLAAAVRAA